MFRKQKLENEIFNEKWINKGDSLEGNITIHSQGDSLEGNITIHSQNSDLKCTQVFR